MPKSPRLEPPVVADEHVQRRQITVQRLAAMQLAEHFEDAGDFAPRRRLGPSLAGPRQERAQIAVARVLEREAVQHAAIGPHQRKGIEHANRAGVVVEQLADVRFAEPAVDAAAHLDAERVRNHRRPAGPPREIHLTEAALAEQPLDAVAEPGLRAGNDFRRGEQTRAVIAAAASRTDGSGGCSGGVLRHQGNNKRKGGGPNRKETN